MMRHRYKDMADRINAMKPGTAWRIPRQEIQDLPSLPDWAVLTNITMGFERVKESVIGSAYPDLWSFIEELNGDITVYRKPEKDGSPKPRLLHQPEQPEPGTPAVLPQCPSH